VLGWSNKTEHVPAVFLGSRFIIKAAVVNQVLHQGLAFVSLLRLLSLTTNNSTGAIITYRCGSNHVLIQEYSVGLGSWAAYNNGIVLLRNNLLVLDIDYLVEKLFLP
jgi:hypothetical protein